MVRIGARGEQDPPGGVDQAALQAARGPGDEAGHCLLGATALGAVARHQEEHARQELADALVHLRIGGSDHRTERRPARLGAAHALRDTGQRLGDPLVERLPAETAILKISRARVAGLDQDEDARTGFPGRVHEGLQCIEPQVGVRGDGIHRQHRLAAEIGLRVAPRSRADVTPLGIEENQQIPFPRSGDDPFEHLHAPPAEALEEGDLGLDDRDPPRQPIQHRQAEGLDGRGGLGSLGSHPAAAEERREAIEMGIQTGTEGVAEPARGHGDAIGKRFLDHLAPGKIRTGVYRSR